MPGGFSSFFGDSPGGGRSRGGNGFGGDPFGAGGSTRGGRSNPESKRARRSNPPKAQRVMVSLEDLMEDSFHTVRVKNRGSVDVEVPKGCPEGHVLEEQGMRFEVHSQPHSDYE